MFCPKCGKDNYEQTRVCRSCGLDLGMIHLAVDGRLPDLSTVMNEEKRRRLLHKGTISTLAGGGFGIVLILTLLHLVAAGGAWATALLILLAVPLLAYGIGSIISAQYVYGRRSFDYAQRFGLVQDLLDANREGALPSGVGFPRSLTETSVTDIGAPIVRQSDQK